MKIELMLYIYITICISLIAFNIVYVFILKNNASRLEKETNEFDIMLEETLLSLKDGKKPDEAHRKKLYKKLKHTAKLSAFDKSLENVYEKYPRLTEQYLEEIYPILIMLAHKYQKSDEIKSAYFPYIAAKYRLLKYKTDSEMTEIMFDMLHLDNVYCRENALKAIYGTGDCDLAAKALKIIDRNASFHHPKLICDGLFSFEGSKAALVEKLRKEFEDFSVDMQKNILDFVRFSGVKSDDMMYGVLTDKNRNRELRFSAIRYFEKFPAETARGAIQDFAENVNQNEWEYSAIASSALKSYPCERTAEILKNNLSSSNWYIRYNSALSCEALGYSYTDLIQVFDGNDRYAREMLQYRFDRNSAKKEAARV